MSNPCDNQVRSSEASASTNYETIAAVTELGSFGLSSIKGKGCIVHCKQCQYLPPMEGCTRHGTSKCPCNNSVSTGKQSESEQLASASMTMHPRFPATPVLQRMRTGDTAACKPVQPLDVLLQYVLNPPTRR